MSFRFCQECSNMLYPKENKSGKTLLFACRNCSYSVEADKFCVYQNQVLMSEKASIVAVDVSNDPTFPRTKKQCPECSWEEAVFFQSNKRADTSMKLFFACCNPQCNHRWIDN